MTFYSTSSQGALFHSDGGKSQESVKFLERLETVKRRGKCTERLELEAVTPRQMFLPGMEKAMRAMPNQVARSSLYAPIARGRRKFHQETILVTRADAVMRYTGEQLDEADATLSMQLIFEARHHPLGEPVALNRAALLRAIGRTTGKVDYEWLHRRLKAMTVATLFIEAKRADGGTKYRIGHTEAFHIIQSFLYNEDMESYTFTLDPRWRSLFGNREFALVDMDKRLRIGRGQDMAKALQRLIATSSDPVQRYSLDWLKAKMQYAGRMRDFKNTITRAVDELRSLDIVAAGRFEVSTKGKEQLTVWLPVSI